jgi:hypothetical protein
MHARPREHAVVLGLSAILVVSTAACGGGGGGAQGGNTTSSVTSTTTQAGPWTGTVRTDYTNSASVGDQRIVSTGGIVYTDLVPLPAGQTEEYSAVTAGGGDTRDTGYCPVTAGNTTQVVTWRAAGRDPNNNGETRASLIISDAVDADTGAPGTTITPSRLALVADVNDPCGNQPQTDLNVLVGGFESADNGRPGTPVPNDDTDPGHLAGTVTYTLASPPYPLRFPPDGQWRYTITYDLRREGVSDSDGDGLSDVVEGATGVDTDHDGTPDYKDLDSDGDDIADSVEGGGDTDGDGTPDFRDLDSDNDGTADSVEGTGDFDGDGTPNFQDPERDAEETEGTCAHPEQNPVFCYAPVVRLHPDEFTFPMDIAEFVTHSRLMWNRDHGCDDEMVAENIDPQRIGNSAANPYTAQEAGWPGCDPSGHQFPANELTAPGVDGKDHGLDKEEGFYLDLDDDQRLGAVPAQRHGQVKAAASYSFSADRRHITYWFMYGFNQGAPGTGTYVDHHEGEWERITVDLDGQRLATHVRYWQHTCTTPETVPYQAVEKAGTHPVVYSALGSHASFPDILEVPREGLCPLDGALAGPLAGQGWGDKTAAGGAEWKTWATDLRDAAHESWYGFGGAWGEVGSHVNSGEACYTAEMVTSGVGCQIDVTGPLGPDQKGLFS